jgi:hypothetical protein
MYTAQQIGSIMRTRNKIWLGVGAFAVVGTAAAAGEAVPRIEAWHATTTATETAVARSVPGRTVTAQHSMAQHDAHPPADKDAGEGNESKAIANLPPQLAFAVRIALLRGHLLVGDELVRQQQWNAALPHFLHPGEEIYADIKDQLADYQVPPFEDALKALANVVKARNGNDYPKAIKAVNDALAAADAGMRAKQNGNWSGFVVEAAIETIKSSTNEYQQAIVGGRLAKPVEYQDARGFILQGERMIDGVAAELQKKDPASLTEVRAGLAELKKAFPSAMPPKTPVKDAAAVLGDVARIELAAGKLM